MNQMERRKTAKMGLLILCMSILCFVGAFWKPLDIQAASKKKVTMTQGKTKRIPKDYYKRMDEIYGNYRQGKYFYTVSCPDTFPKTARTLYITKYSTSFKYISVRKIKLPKYEKWGGFYYAPDGNFYIALGTANWTDSKKMIIQIIKYDKNWKKKNTYKIYSDGESDIRYPFNTVVAHKRSSNPSVAFAMNKNMLYLSTGIDYAEPGYMSLISSRSWMIDTTTGKVEKISPYIGGYYGTQMKVRNGKLYSAGIGPELMHLQVSVTDEVTPENRNSTDFNAFELTRTSDEMDVYAELSGLEVGNENILACGIAQPNSSKIRGYTGVNSNYIENVYLTITNVNTGETKIKWLTTFNPKTSEGKKYVIPPQIIRLSKLRYAVLFEVREINKKNWEWKSTLYYRVIDETGKIISKKTYRGYHLDRVRDIKPVLKGNYIYWCANDDDSYIKRKVDFFRIPVK